MKLNKFIADAGVTSRRDAVNLIKNEHIAVNGITQTNPAYEVQPHDTVTMNGKRLRTEEKVYLVMNKPNGYITSVEDERGRKTVMDLVTPFVKERVVPVGRLDRDTTGLLLLTNDGELTLRLTHPRYNIEKVYIATLDRSLDSTDLMKLRKGVKLEDGFMKVDHVGFIDGASAKVVTVTIHSGKNRIVKRLFEHLGYSVEQLHRSKFGPLVLHGIGKGKIRPLTDDELEQLLESVHLDGKSIIKKAMPSKAVLNRNEKPRKEPARAERLPVIKPFKSEQTDWRKAEAEEIRHMQESFAAFEESAKKKKRANSSRQSDDSQPRSSYKRSGTKAREDVTKQKDRSTTSSRFQEDKAPRPTRWSANKDQAEDKVRTSSYSYKRSFAKDRDDSSSRVERPFASSRFKQDKDTARSDSTYYRNASSKPTRQSRRDDEYEENVTPQARRSSYKNDKKRANDTNDSYRSGAKAFEKKSSFKKPSSSSRTNQRGDKRKSTQTPRDYKKRTSRS